MDVYAASYWHVRSEMEEIRDELLLDASGFCVWMLASLVPGKTT